MGKPVRQPYKNIRVLDLTQGIAGPYCAEILLQNGATVIKVEPPTGDWGRTIGYAPEGMSAIAIAYNLGKRSICIDATKSEGQAILRRLALEADVVLESFRPSTMARLGLSYESLSRERPDMVYVSVTAFGEDGPYADRPGSDSTLQAMSGLMVANQDQNGTPRKVGILVVDVVTGISAAQATATALYQRAIEGEGSHVNVSLLEGVAAAQSNAIIDAALGGGRPARPLSVPAGTFATADGYINVTSLHDRMFVGLCKAVAHEAWLDDARFDSVEARFEHAAELNALLNDIFRVKPTEHWLKMLREHSVVAAPIQGYAEFLDDPQVKHQALFRQVDLEGVPPVPVPCIPGVSPDAIPDTAPRLGEHTRSVLAELGLSAMNIEALFADGVVTEAVGVAVARD